MPPQRPGEPAEGGGDDREPVDGHDDDLDDVAYRPPLPPEDRLWRHPSEVALAPTPPAPTAAQGPRTAALMLLAGAIGATVAVASVALLGGFEERVVERRVSARPAAVVDEDTEAIAVLAHEAAPSVAALVVRRGEVESAASAVVVRSDGYLVTDAEVVDGADGVDVVLHDGVVSVGEVVGADPPTGIAVLRVDADGLRPAVLGRSAALDVGSRTVLVAATAEGGWNPTVTSGLVSTVARRVVATDGTARYGMLVVDKPFGAGAPGGALLGSDGAVVGIATAMRGAAADDRSGVATPIELADHVARQLIADGHVRHVWMGLHGRDVDPADATATATVGYGALVEDVTADGPAARAGIAPGDVVVAVDGEPIPSMAALIAALRLHLPGDVVTASVWRDGGTIEVEVELAAKGA